MGKRLDYLTGKFIEDKPPVKRKRPEASVGNDVDKFLRGLGGYVRQINSGGTLRNGRWTTGGQGAGISDRICWLPSGRCIAIELKAPGKKRTASDLQHEFLKNLISRGHVGCIADSIECVKLALSQSQSELLTTLENLKPKSRYCPSSEPLFP